MRRLAILMTIAALAPSAALAQSIAVNIDQAQRVTTSHAVKDVIVGNPMVADAIILDQHHLLVTGRSYGVTNLMVTDAAGRTVLNRQLVVTAPDYNRVSVYRGPDVYNYACNAKCERTPMPGERAQGVYDPYAAPYNEYAGRAKNGEQTSGQTSAP